MEEKQGGTTEELKKFKNFQSKQIPYQNSNPLIIYLRGIPKKAKEEELQEFLKKYAPQVLEALESVSFAKFRSHSNRNTGKGEVRVKTQTAKKALHSTSIILRGVKIKILTEAPREMKVASFEKNRAYFYGELQNLEPNQIQDAIPKSFQVVRIQILKEFKTGENKNFGFVDFKIEQERDLFIKNLRESGKISLEIGGSFVNFIKPQEKLENGDFKVDLDWKRKQMKIANQKKKKQDEEMREILRREELKKQRWGFLKPSTEGILNANEENYCFRRA